MSRRADGQSVTLARGRLQQSGRVGAQRGDLPSALEYSQRL